MAGPLLQAKFVFALDDRLTLKSVGPAVKTLLGFAPNELLSGKVRLRDRVHPDDAALADSIFSTNDKGRPRSFVLRLRHADGRIRVAKGQSKRKLGGGGEALLELLLQNARTVKEPDDAKLAASFKFLLKRVSDFVYIKNRNHVILATNRNIPDLTESAQDWTELAGQTDYDLHPEEMADANYRLEEKVLAEDEGAEHVVHVRTQDHGLRWINDRKYPLKGSRGEVIGILGVAPDVTEYAEPHERLHESEETLREVQRIAGLGSYRFDFGKGVWTSSDVMDQIFGIDKDYNHSFDGWAALVHPDDRSAMVAYFKDEVIGQRRPFDKEYRIVRPSDGKARWVHGLGQLEFDDQGNPVKMLGTIRDITEARLAKESLQESKNLLQLFIEHAPVAIAMLDREMRYIEVSRRWLEMLGISDRSLSGQSHYQYLSTLPGSMRAEHRQALAGETTPIREGEISRPDGSQHWVRREMRPWFGGDGQVAGVILFVEDITEARQAQESLRESKELLQLFTQHAPVALAMFDREMRYVAMSRRWIESYGLDEDKILGHSHYEVFPEIPERWKALHRRALEGESIRSEEDRFDRADGGTQWLRWELVPWRTGDGSVGGIIIFVDDITKQKETENRMRLAASVFTGAREGITITDPHGSILEVNDAFTRITGYSREEAIGQNPRILKSGLQGNDFYENMWSTLARDGHWSGEMWNRTKAGDIYAEMLSINAIRDGDGKTTQYVALFSDISEIKEKQQQLDHIAHYDALTGLPNRPLFADRLRQAMAHAHRNKQVLAVAYFDLDGFKEINDRHGHPVGDALLTAMAFRMKRVMREGDTLARLGGDEFAAVMLDLDNAKAVAPALNRLLGAASEEAQIGEVFLQVSASAGVTFYPQEEEVDADVLLRQSGQAMYQAKLAGRNRYHFFDASEDLLTRSHNEDIEHIRKALDARQFLIHYQPKVNMRTGRVIGAEALVRWQHPTRGLLPPGLFLPVIEAHPLTIELGAWITDTVLRQMEAWQAAGLDLPVSINVSAMELQQPDFPGRLRSLLTAHPKIDPSNLELEILETSALQDVVQASNVLQDCRDIGVRIALDDFGTGYSSLTYLKGLPANILKIDQSFVRGILESPESLTILEAVMGLASAFRLEVIAEGVETVDQGSMLLQLGCELAQGYGIARPMASGELQSWITNWRPDARWAEVPPMHRDNSAILYARVEHRAWLAAFEAYLHGKRSTPPAMGVNQCRLGTLLRDERQSLHGSMSAILAVETLHRQVHGLAEEITGLYHAGQKTEGLAHLGELHSLHKKLLGLMKSFANLGVGQAGNGVAPSRAGKAPRAGVD